MIRGNDWPEPRKGLRIAPIPSMFGVCGHWRTDAGPWLVDRCSVKKLSEKRFSKEGMIWGIIREGWSMAVETILHKRHFNRYG